MDDAAATYTVPPERMKAKLKYRVPIAARAVAVLDEARDMADMTVLVFPFPTSCVLSDRTLSKLLRELCIGTLSHRFRSSFRYWVAAATVVLREVCELALTHVNGDRVEAVYRSSELFERRRELMAEWTEYIGGDAAAVG